MAIRLPRHLGVEVSEVVSQASSKLNAGRKLPSWVWAMGIAVTIFAVLSWFILKANSGADIQFRISLEPLLSAPVLVQAHVFGAVSAVTIGTVLLCAPKGFGLHKTLGWSWVIAMVLTAGSSFFLTGLMGRSYSPIHALSAWTIIGLPFGIAAIRRRDVAKHSKTMTGMFVGGMLVAGMFSFLPGRLMWTIFFGS